MVSEFEMKAKQSVVYILKTPDDKYFKEIEIGCSREEYENILLKCVETNLKKKLLEINSDMNNYQRRFEILFDITVRAITHKG